MKTTYRFFIAIFFICVPQFGAFADGQENLSNMDYFIACMNNHQVFKKYVICSMPLKNKFESGPVHTHYTMPFNFKGKTYYADASITVDPRLNTMVMSVSQETLRKGSRANFEEIAQDGAAFQQLMLFSFVKANPGTIRVPADTRGHLATDPVGNRASDSAIAAQRNPKRGVSPGMPVQGTAPTNRAPAHYYQNDASGIGSGG